MIDSVSLVWGGKSESNSAGHDHRTGHAKPQRFPVSEPIYLDWRELAQNYGDTDGQVRSIKYGAKSHEYGHWQVGDVELLYNGGRVELRASLPKVLTGRNDLVLDEKGVHDGLQELVRVGREITQANLQLRDAVPTRLDFAYQWQVPSVAWIVEHLRACFHPAQKLRTENLSPKGGVSLTYGYGSKRVIRFYDKGAEVAEQEIKALRGFAPDAGITEGMNEYERIRAIAKARVQLRNEIWHNSAIDTVLRYEIQERNPGVLRAIHEHGYTATEVRGALQRTVSMLAAVSCRDFAGLVEHHQRNGSLNAIAMAAASLHFAEHEADLKVVRLIAKDRKTFYTWRRRAREARLFVADWEPTIPDTAFSADSSLWLADVA